MDVVICTCGTNIGSSMSAMNYVIDLRKKALLAEHKLKNILVTNVFNSDNYEFEIGTVMDAFGFHLSCCRTSIICRDPVMKRIL